MKNCSIYYGDERAPDLRDGAERPRYLKQELELVLTRIASGGVRCIAWLDLAFSPQLALKPVEGEKIRP